MASQLQAIDLCGIGPREFEDRVREAVRDSGNLLHGQSPAPWEVVMEAVIALKWELDAKKG